MDYFSILPNDIRCEICSYLTPQEILYSCCINKVFLKFLTEEFWHRHVTRTYFPQDFGVDKFDSGVLAYLNTTSWTELAKLSFARRTIPAVVTIRYGIRKQYANMTFELNFFSSWKDIKNDLIKYFKIPANNCLKMMIKGHIDKDTEVAITATGQAGRFEVHKWRVCSKGSNRSQVVSHAMGFEDDSHVGMFNIMNINFFSKIETIQLDVLWANAFTMTDDKKIIFSSTRQATLVSQINTHLLPEEKLGGYVERFIQNCIILFGLVTRAAYA
jgi:hypothetical protein